MNLFTKKKTANKVLVDIGQSQIGILGIHYSGGKVSVSGSYAADMMNNPNAGEIADFTKSTLIDRVIKKGDIILSIPSELVQYRIESAKNMKMSALDKYIRSNNKLGNEYTHIIDWSYLGERVENGDTLKYYMTATVKKSFVMQYVTEFSKRGLNVTDITFLENNIVCLSDLYKNDAVNKLYINFGSNSTIIFVEKVNTLIYSRVVDQGLDTAASETDLQNEVLRVIQMCENDGIEISKIISVGATAEGLLDDFSANGIEIEVINEKSWNDVTGDGYTLSLTNSDVEGNFSPEIGASFAAMQKQKRINLMPSEYKEKQANKRLLYSFGMITAIIALVMAVVYINLAVANYTLSKLRTQDSEYNQKLEQIEQLEALNKSNDEFIDQYERVNFPFYNFMQFIQYNKPRGLTIISVDSVNKLLQKTETPEETEQELAENNNTEDSNTTDNNTENKNAQNEDNGGETTPALLPEPQIKDLMDEKLSIRGYSNDSTDISAFLYDLAQIPYVSDLELKAIEENKIGGSDIILFEAILKLGGKSNVISN